MVWSACLVFFQTALLVGYIYARWLTTLVPDRKQVLIHGALLVIALLFLPPIPELDGQSMGNISAPLQVLQLLSSTIGVPFALLATTEPLIQR